MSLSPNFISLVAAAACRLPPAACRLPLPLLKAKQSLCPTTLFINHVINGANKRRITIIMLHRSSIGIHHPLVAIATHHMDTAFHWSHGHCHLKRCGVRFSGSILRRRSGTDGIWKSYTIFTL